MQHANTLFVLPFLWINISPAVEKCLIKLKGSLKWIISALKGKFDFCSAVDAFCTIQKQVNSALPSINFGSLCNYIFAITCTCVIVLVICQRYYHSLRLNVEFIHIRIMTNWTGRITNTSVPFLNNKTKLLHSIVIIPSHFFGGN